MMDRISAADLRAMQKPAKKNKFGAKRCQYDGIWFDSQAERNYYIALKDREKSGEVTAVELQKPFPLFAPSGQVVGSYRSDFAFQDLLTNRFRVIDVKGFDTPLSKWKRKHVKAQYGIDVEIAK